MYQQRPVRRSQLITPFGVGAILNFPGDESLMTCGLDVWPFALEECPQELRITEERLQQRLRVSHFRLPPEYRDPGPGVEHPRVKVPFIRFPRWHYCPRCGAMEKLEIYSNPRRPQRCKGPNYKTGMSCHTLTDWKRPHLIPVRFIALCEAGHIEDFPFLEWVHWDNDKQAFNPITEHCHLRLRAGRSASALSGIIINCDCGAWKTMAGAFNPDSLKKIKLCSGHRPWLGEVDDRAGTCEQSLQVVQRGASNVYFPNVVSSIYLPKYHGSYHRRVIEVLDKNWENLTDSRVDGQLNEAVFKFVASTKGVDFSELLQAAKDRLETEKTPPDDAQEEHPEETYRKAEYDAMLAGLGGDNQDFSVKLMQPDKYASVIGNYFSSIALVEKLRETRALAGFSRYRPGDSRTIAKQKAQLALSRRVDWLPAIVVRGEGIFFGFDLQKLNAWLEQTDLLKRANVLLQNYQEAWFNRDRDLEWEVKSFARLVLLHTFAHILINRFSFECGYGSSALRERIYCNLETDEPMNGILIYTASGDSEGSLGGLVRQGKPGNLENIVTAALYEAQWCSSDPICMESHGQGPDSCNLAACHSCALLPETSCERGNRLLDRTLLVGLPDQRELGYFTGFEAMLDSYT